MTEFDWTQIRTTTIGAFGGTTPGAELEQRIIDAFLLEPNKILAAIGTVTEQFAAGKVRSPWAILDLNIRNATNPTAHVVAQDTTEKKRRIARAEAWIHNAGVHFDRPEEIEDELFSERGLLGAYHADAKLETRMLDLWREKRPLGEALETEAEQRAADWKTSQARLRIKPVDAYEADLPEPEYALAGELPPPDESSYDPDTEDA